MSLHTRLKRLEQARTKTGPEYGLYDTHGNAVEAELVQEPTPEAEGLARLPDGTEKAVIWQGKVAFIFDADVRTDKLWWIRQDGLRVYFGNRITEEDL